MRRSTLCFAALVALAACGEGSPGLTDGAGTVGNVGRLPDEFRPVSPAAAPTASTSPTRPTPSTLDERDRDDGDDGERSAGSADPTGAVATTADGTTDDAPARSFSRGAAGNRVLAVGDSITQAIGPEYGGQLCEDLEARGWFVGVDAEQGRDVAEAADALDAQLDDGDWDAVVINAGSNYRGDIDDYIREVERMLARAGDRPVLVVTVTEWEPEIADVNAVLHWIAAAEDDEVWLVDWAARTAADESLTGDDGLHLSEVGRERLATLIARAAGWAEGDGDTGCEDLLDGAGSDAGDGDDRPSGTSGTSEPSDGRDG